MSDYLLPPWLQERAQASLERAAGQNRDLLKSFYKARVFDSRVCRPLTQGLCLTCKWLQVAPRPVSLSGYVSSQTPLEQPAGLRRFQEDLKENFCLNRKSLKELFNSMHHPFSSVCSLFACVFSILEGCSNLKSCFSQIRNVALLLPRVMTIFVRIKSPQIRV